MLRKAVRRVNQILNQLKVRQHADKTFVGRVSRGFDFLGYTFSAVGLTGVLLCEVLRYEARVAPGTAERFVEYYSAKQPFAAKHERATRLYEPCLPAGRKVWMKSASDPGALRPHWLCKSVWSA